MLCSDPCPDADDRVAKEDNGWTISVIGQTRVCPNWYEQLKTGSHIVNWFTQPPTPDSRVRCTNITRKPKHISLQISDGISLTPSTPAVPNCCCSKGSAPYWTNPPFLIFDIRALWRSVLSVRAPECQKLKMVG